MSPLVYWQLDVFAERPLAGNGVAVFPDARQLTPAALLHHLQDPATDAEWTLQLAAKSVRLLTRRQERGFYAQMDQGVAEFAAQLAPVQAQVIAEAFGLSGAQLDRRYPASVVSTGLPYLILPVTAH